MRKTFILRGCGEPETLVIDGHSGSWRVVRRDETAEVQAVRLPDGRFSIILSDGRQICGRALPRGRRELEVSTSRGVTRMSLTDQLHDQLNHRPAGRGPNEAGEEVRAMIPGRIVEVAVAPGDRVEKGSLLLVLEAMKMQNEIRAEQPGVVSRVGVRAGEAVEGGALMLTVQPATS